jgi:hypothetical protein
MPEQQPNGAAHPTIVLPATPAPTTDVEREIVAWMVRWGTPVLGSVGAGNDAEEDYAQKRLPLDSPLIDPLLSYVRQLPHGAPETHVPTPTTENEWRHLEALGEASDDIDIETEFGAAAKTIKYRVEAARAGVTEERVRLAHTLGKTLFDLSDLACSQEYSVWEREGRVAGTLYAALVPPAPEDERAAIDALPELFERFAKLVVQARRDIVAAARHLEIDATRFDYLDDAIFASRTRAGAEA